MKKIELTPKQITDLFVCRKDCFATQQSSGAYYPTRRPITEADIQKHLDGEITIGLYCLDTNNTIKWACVDIDGDKKLSPATNKKLLYPEAIIIYDTFKDFPRILEFSGRKGYHIWVFFTPRVTADYGQKLIKSRLNRVGLNRHEVFPKQTELNEGRKYGNLVKVIFAYHKKSGLRSEVIKMDLKKVLK